MNMIPEFHTFVKSTDPDIILDNESWLKEGIKKVKYSHQDITYTGETEHQVIRNQEEVYLFQSGKSTHTLRSSQTQNQTWGWILELKMKDQQNLRVGSIYRPSWSDDKYMEDLDLVLVYFETDVVELCTEKTIILHIIFMKLST